jgi:hypothetical protein
VPLSLRLQSNPQVGYEEIVGSNGRRASSSGHERDYDKDYGDNEQHVSNPSRFASHTAGTKRFGYQSNDQKNDRVF